jgi:hypothetical protein
MDNSESVPLEHWTLRQTLMSWSSAAQGRCRTVVEAVTEMVFHSADVRRLVVRDFRRRLRAARRLAENSGEKRDLRRALQPHLKRLAVATVQQHVVRAGWIGGILLLGLIAGIAFPAVGFGVGSRPIPERYAYLFAAWYLAMVASAAMVVRSKRQRDETSVAILINFLLLALLFMLSHLRAAETTSVVNAVAVASVAGVLTVAGIFSVRFLAHLFTRQRRCVNERRHPDTAVVDELLTACELLHAPEQRWQLTSSKRELFTHLDAAADIAENYLPGALNGKDHAFNHHVNNQCAGMASGVRELKRWILTPKEDTYPLLRQRLRFTLCCFANGVWDPMPTGHAVINEPRVFRDAILFLRRALTALFPLGFLLMYETLPIAQRIPIPLAGQAAVALSTFVSLLLLLDPQLPEKVSITHRVADLLMVLRPKDR